MLNEAVDARSAARICGFKTTSMLDYLERSGVFVRKRKNEARRGKGRRYTFRDLLILKVMGQLLSNGASVHSMKKALIEFQEKKWDADRASFSIGDQKIRYLTVSSGELFFTDSHQNLYDMTNGGQMAFGFILDLDRLHSDLCHDLDQREFRFKTA
jgi:DNA-binding transcriptional MerR regulator